jgi:chromosomal replication initiation ATPase DnaA
VLLASTPCPITLHPQWAQTGASLWMAHSKQSKTCRCPAAPNRFKLDWVKTQFAARITALAHQYWEAPIEVQFVLDPKNNLPKKVVAPVPAPQADGSPGLPRHPGGHAGEAAPAPEMLNISGANKAGSTPT